MCPQGRGGHIGATWRIRLSLCFLQHTWVHSPNCKSIGSAMSAQLTAESAYTLQCGTLSPKIAHSRGGFGTPIYFMIPWGRPSPQFKLHHDWFSYFHTGDCRVSLYFTMERSFPPQNCPFPWGDLDPHLIHGSLGPPKSSTQMALDRFSRFSRAH